MHWIPKVIKPGLSYTDTLSSHLHNFFEIIIHVVFTLYDALMERSVFLQRQYISHHWTSALDSHNPIYFVLLYPYRYRRNYLPVDNQGWSEPVTLPVCQVWFSHPSSSLTQSMSIRTMITSFAPHTTQNRLKIENKLHSNRLTDPGSLAFFLLVSNTCKSVKRRPILCDTYVGMYIMSNSNRENSFLIPTALSSFGDANLLHWQSNGGSVSRVLRGDPH